MLDLEMLEKGISSCVVGTKAIKAESMSFSPLELDVLRIPKLLEENSTLSHVKAVAQVQALEDKLQEKGEAVKKEEEKSKTSEKPKRQDSTMEYSTKLDLKKLIPSCVEPPTLELKPLPSNLKYAYLIENEKLPVACDLCINWAIEVNTP
ncbi:uncharacterized protein LOC129299564 isoform X1 [Prosopis cineraria]|uniref:uncharacterized protein LOC129299564 isoform X1 n=1 Tax=Prosopis cineraria TaxID=364024 RepID=UPI002410AB81|nr:uncharacterized protein LOC129299564 isoform X1 [Prosopis cineraria]